jgi:hypothetical protein
MQEEIFVSRVDFDQYAAQYEAILAAQTNFFDGDSNYFACCPRASIGGVAKTLNRAPGAARSRMP